MKETMPNHERQKVKLLQRIRRTRGQMDALEWSLETDQDCGDQLLLLAAIRGGINGLMG
jgi:DNA-binding FrmR family transcriptional regulator